jgi:AbrB family looped-hinge helix DNA binding protein
MDIFSPEDTLFLGFKMVSEIEVKVRVSKKYTTYIPKRIAEAVGLQEGSIVRLRVID